MTDDNDDDDMSITCEKKKDAIPGLGDSQSDKEEDDEKGKKIKPGHILKIAAELLMDFA